MSALEVYGLKELRRDLRRVEPELTPYLRTELKAAGDVVVRRAKRRVVGSIKDQDRSDRLAENSLRVTSGGNVLYVQGGNASTPYYGWLDFGGTLRPTGARRNTQKRPRVSGGRYIYPALAESNKELADAVARAVDRTLDKLDI